MTKKERALAAIEALEKLYPDAICSLDYEKPYELLISVRLSAQCTDARVNTVTPTLFSRYPTLESLASADIADIEEIIRPCGFFRIKARDIVALSQMLLRDYGGELPDSLEELCRLPGVGRKSANLIMGDVFHQPAVVTDTHCIRICYRLGLTTKKEPYPVELELRKILPPEKSNDFCHRLVLFGREFCKAPTPRCEGCPLSGICKEFASPKKRTAKKS